MKFLNVSADTQLRHERVLYLKALGFDVINARNATSAITTLELDNEFDFAILCHTLTDEDKLLFTSFLKQTGARTLVVELVLADLPVTSGVALEADRDFQPVMVDLAESLDSAREPSPSPAESETGLAPALRYTLH